MHNFNFEEAITAAKALQEGKVLLYPTDTIWGLGCSIEFPEKLDQIYKIKKRPLEKSAILLVSDIEMLKQYITSIHPRIETLHTLHQKPLTVIYPAADTLDPAFVAADGSVAIRICQDAFCQEMIKLLNKPIVSTSANISGSPPPSHFGEISSEIITAVDFVVRYRQNDMTAAVPSVIIKYQSDGEIIVIRE